MEESLSAWITKGEPEHSLSEKKNLMSTEIWIFIFYSNINYYKVFISFKRKERRKSRSDTNFPHDIQLLFYQLTALKAGNSASS